MFYYTADWHYSHKNIIKYEDRPFSDISEMNRKLIYNHNSIVNPDDVWFCLGDLSFDTSEETHKLLSQLNGQKVFIAGNHDRLIMKKNKKLQSHFMAVISDNLIIRDNGYKILLSHVPIMDWQTKYKVDYHFYGHVHSNNHRKHYNLIGTPSYNVGVDVCDFKPVSFNDIMLLKQKQ